MILQSLRGGSLLFTLGATLAAALCHGQQGTASSLAGGLHSAAALALALYFLLCWPGLTRKGRLFLLMAASLLTARVVASLAGGASPLPQVMQAARQACFIASLYTALGFLREAAETSSLVRRCGAFLAGQPAGKRYAALLAGGHLFGLILNFGSIALLGPLVMAATAPPAQPPAHSLPAAGEHQRRLRQQRMMTAIHRGFGCVLAWSPMTVSTTVVLSAIAPVPWEQVAPWEFLAAMLMMAAGWGLDRLLPAGPRRHLRPEAGLAAENGLAAEAVSSPVAGSWWLVMPFCLLVLAIFSIGAIGQALLRVPLVIAVMMATPPVAVLWLYRQEGSLRNCLGRLRHHSTHALYSYRGELSLLSSAVFAGSLLAGFIPAPAVSALLLHTGLPAPLFLCLAFGIIVLLGQTGLNPLLTVTLLASVLPPPAVLGVPPAAVTVALGSAWALAAVSSPFAAASMLIGAMTGVGANTAGSRWNGLFALVSWFLVSLLVLALSLVL